MKVRRVHLAGGIVPTLVPLFALTAALLGIAGPAIAAGQPDAAMVEARRQKSNPSLNMLTYRHFDELFDNRPVDKGGRTSVLPASDLTLPDDAALKIDDQTVRLADHLSSARVNALVVLRDGKLVREIYRQGGQAQNRFIAFSMSKSMISMLVGMAISDRKIGSVDELVTQYLPELRGTAYDGVKIRDLLTMRTGTSWIEDYSPGTELDRVRDMSWAQETAFYEDHARKLTRVAEPGTRFNYSTLDTELLGTILNRATGRTVAEFMSERLWKPAGMEAPAYWVMQGPTGRQHEFYGAGFAATARDYARVGQMMLNDGRSGGRQVVPRDWVKQSTTSATPGANYFFQWWGIKNIDGFAARGVYGQSILVDRTSRTVMVVLSYGADPSGDRRTDSLFKAVVDYLDHEKNVGRTN